MTNPHSGRLPHEDPVAGAGDTGGEPAADGSDPVPGSAVDAVDGVGGLVTEAGDTTEELVLGKGDRPRSRVERQLRTVVEWVAVAVGALAVALVIKAFLLQAFYIPSGSMEPTLQQGDRVLVNKLSYDLHDINRGDVVVFEKPPGESGDIDDLIKRVVALPGETVELDDGHIYIDGQLLDEPYLGPDTPTIPKAPIPNCENSPTTDQCTVSEGTVFVLGDNRESSRDSRFFGPIQDDSVVGRAFVKVWPIGDISFL